MSLQLEAVVQRVARTLQVMWPNIKVHLSSEDVQHNVHLLELRLQLPTGDVGYRHALQNWEGYTDDGYYDHLMRAIPQQFVAQLADMACAAAKRDRFSNQPARIDSAHTHRRH